MKKLMLLLPILLAACGDNLTMPDAQDVNPCCDLGAEGAAECFSAELPIGTCAVFVCPDFRGEACGPPRPVPAQDMRVGGPAVDPRPR